jgi:hypothetical protein
VRRAALSALILAVAALALGACKGDPVKCDEACRNFATLVYWKRADAKVAAEPPERRDALRKQLLGEFTKELAGGIDQCVSQCRSANNTGDIDCMIAAKTADQALACVE